MKQTNNIAYLSQLTLILATTAITFFYIFAAIGQTQTAVHGAILALH